MGVFFVFLSFCASARAEGMYESQASAAALFHQALGKVTDASQQGKCQQRNPAVPASYCENLGYEECEAYSGTCQWFGSTP
jgi:hypothetical protein